MTIYTEPAPAKINLFLHLTGKRSDGYHDLDSLVVFAPDICDYLHYIPGNAPLDFKVTGPFAADTPSDNRNLVIQALTRLAPLMNAPLTGKLTLEKNLPVGAGIGGGSSDAAAAIRLFARLYNIQDQGALMDVAARLGSDIPACLQAAAGFIIGRGENISPSPRQLQCPVVLVNPMIPLGTAAVFQAHKTGFHSPLSDGRPPQSSLRDFYNWLQGLDNSLTDAAISLCPEIRDVLNALEDLKDCRLTRMSGSGATCFALFDQPESAKNAAARLKKQHPDWWVQYGLLT